MTRRREIMIILAVLALSAGSFLLHKTALAQVQGEASDCEVKVAWTPNPVPWHQSSYTGFASNGQPGATTFTFSEGTCEKYDGTVCTAADYSWDILGPCTTSAAAGATCTVPGVVARTDFQTRPPNNSTPIVCTFPSATWTSPTNRIDNTPPVCGTSWSSFNAQGQTTLSGSSDSQSGLAASNNYTCQAAPGQTCSVTIYDDSIPQNSATCGPSPVNPNINPPPPSSQCSASIYWTNSAGNQVNSVGPGDSATEHWDVQGASVVNGTPQVYNDCTMGSTDLGLNLVSPSGQNTFTKIQQDITCSVQSPADGTSCSKSATVSVDTSGLSCANPNYVYVESNIPATWCINLSSLPTADNRIFRQVADISAGWLGDLAGRNLLARTQVAQPGPCYIQQKTPILSYGYQPNPFGVYSITPDTMPGYGTPQITTVPPNGTISQCSTNPAVQVINQVNFTLNYPPTGPPNPPACGGKIVVDSNQQTTWLISGPQPETQSAPTAGPVTYNNMSCGVYAINPATTAGLDGYIVATTPSVSQTLTNGSTVYFHLNYTEIPNPPPCSPTLTVSPPSETINVGATASYDALYDPDGPTQPDGSCSQPAQNVALAANWTIDNAALAVNLGGGKYKGTLGGMTNVHAAYAGLTGVALLTINPPGGPYYGCVQNKCAQVPGANQNTDGCNAGNAGTSCNVSIGFHAECVANSCKSVINSPGNTKDRCGNDSDCHGGGGGGGCQGSDCNPIHGECNATEQACVNKTGTLPAGKVACGADPACGGREPTHFLCENNTCVIVGGSGQNEGGCAAVGASCSVNPSGACQFFKANPGFITKGQSSTLSWQCDSGVQNCTIQGSPVPATGTKSVSPSVSTQYIFSCNGVSTPLYTTVYVIQSYKETNPGGQ